MPDEPSHSSFTVDGVNNFLSKSFENISPFKYQVNKTKVNKLCYWELSETSSPRPRDRILEILTGSDDSKNDNNELTLLLDAYKSADSDKQKIMILSAIDPKPYTKEQVMNIFNRPRYKVDAAWKWLKVVGPLHKQKKNFH